MSLILDALRKLERERGSRESVLVVGAVPWGERRQSRLPLALASLAVVLLALAGGWWWRSSSRPPAPSPSAIPSPPAVVPSTPAPPPAAPLAVPPPRRIAVPPPEVERAVPAPAGAPLPEGPPAEVRLNAITQRDGRPLALINDRLVFEGDSFDGIKVLHIGEAEVEVEIRGQRRVLRF